ncbi:beta strand repeat-containing protein [Pseudobdellovibrio sp. HCB154]|uniref:beta strand repeat-containing protein n=1 Tax=Pseudobdellovibrio sp. HCB154 TaxID=3386277 RepID=UPI003916E3CF
MAFTHFAWATPQVTTYQARIIKPDGYPLEANSVNFKFTILNPTGNCILYSETYSSVSMAGTGGLMSFPLGSGITVYPTSGTTFADVFDNSVASLTCDAGGPGNYSPGSSDIRKIVMQFNDGNGWQTLPAMNINAVPYAIYANDAMKLGGVSATSFVQYSTLPTCTASESLSYNGASFSCVAAGAAPTNVTSSTVITALGYTPADGASVTALSSSLSSTNANVSAVSSTLSNVSAYASAVSSTLYSVSSTVSTLENSVSSLQSTVASNSAAIATLQSDLSAVSATLNNSLVKTNNLSDLTNVTTARANLGLGTFATANSLDLGSASATGTIADARLANQNGVVSGTQYTKVTVDGKGRVTSGSQLSSADVTTALGFTPASASAATQWTTSGTTINYMSGYVGIGTVTPMTKLDVDGGVRISMESATCAVSYAGTLRYNAGSVEFCNGTTWAAFGVSSSGLTSLNGSTSQTQTFANGSVGNAPTFNTSNGIHTLNIPLASAAGSVTAGLISNADYVNFSNKASSAAVAALQSDLSVVSATAGNALVKSNNLSDLTSSETARNNLGLGTFATANSLDLGSASATGTLAVARLPSFSGDATSTSGSNVLTLVDSGVTAATYTKVTVDSKGRVTSGAQLSANDVTTALGYTPQASGVISSQWTTSGTTINYAAGNVGIGTSAPAYTLDVSGVVNVKELKINGVGFSPAMQWSVNGNSGTSATTNFIGTTDNVDLVFKRNNTQAGVIGLSRTAFGLNALSPASTGSYNAAFGNGVLRNNTTGYQNTGVGDGALEANTTGASNAAFGIYALDSNTGGNYNVGVGQSALSSNTSGSFNTAVGTDALVFSTTAAYNTALGFDALFSNTTGSMNTAVGYQAGYNPTVSLQTNSNSVFLGASATTSVNGLTNVIAIGYQARATQSHQVVLGNNSITQTLLRGNVGIGTETPVTKLDVSGGVRISMESATCAVSYAGTLRYNAGNVEFCNGTTWAAFGVATAGVTSLNGSTSQTQTFANGVAGNAPAFTTANGVHTLNIPLASATGSVTAGLISNADYVNFSNKITSSAAAIAQVLGYTPASATALGNYLVKANNLSDLTSSATARTNLGLGAFATMSSLDLGSVSATGTLAVARLPAFAGDVSSTAGSNSLTVAGLRGISVSTTTPVSGQILTYNGSTWAPAAAGNSSQWTTSGTAISYSTGNVGIGTSSPATTLDVNGAATFRQAYFEKVGALGTLACGATNITGYSTNLYTLTACSSGTTILNIPTVTGWPSGSMSWTVTFFVTAQTASTFNVRYNNATTNVFWDKNSTGGAGGANYSGFLINDATTNVFTCTVLNTGSVAMYCGVSAQY